MAQPEENKALKRDLQHLQSKYEQALLQLEKQTQIEKAYTESQLRFRTIFEASKFGNTIIAPDLTIIQVNKALQRRLGYNEQELVGSKIVDFAHPQYAKQWQELEEQLWTKKIPSFSIQACLMKKGGTLIWCQVTSILFADQATTLGYTILEDITEQKIYQQKVEEFQTLLKQSQEIAHIGYYDMDTESHTVFATAETYKILGLQGANDTNPWQIFLDATHPEDRHWVDAAVRKAIQTHSLYSVEHRIIQPSGEERWIWSTGKLTHDQVSHKTRLIGVIIDVTDRNRSAQLENANKKLAARNDELDNFVYTASHDLHSPVNSIEMLIQQLSKEIQGTSQNADLYMGLVNKSILHLKRTLQDLTAVTEIHAGEKKELVNLEDIVEEVMVSLYQQIQEAAATIEIDFQIPFLTIPKKHAKSLIFNLLSNALKFRSKERKLIIHISSFLKGDRIQLRISDNGIGIRERDQAKVFMIFKRFTHEVEGRGVGMYLVKRIIDLNNGEIYMESKENKGTAFHILFPMVS